MINRLIRENWYEDFKSVVLLWDGNTNAEAVRHLQRESERRRYAARHTECLDEENASRSNILSGWSRLRAHSTSGARGQPPFKILVRQPCRIVICAGGRRGGRPSRINGDVYDGRWQTRHPTAHYVLPGVPSWRVERYCRTWDALNAPESCTFRILGYLLWKQVLVYSWQVQPTH